MCRAFTGAQGIWHAAAAAERVTLVRAAAGRCEHPALWRGQADVERVYPAVIRAARGVFRALGLRITVEGDEHVPGDGPVVLASNHVSFLDFLLVGLAARRSGATCGSWPGTTSGPTRSPGR